MTNQEFQEFYKKNKVAVIGVPIIIGILLLDMLVLKPGRRKKTEGDQPAVTTTQAAAPGTVQPGPAVDPLAPPAPLNVPILPSLKAEVERRFFGMESYPYPAGKNIFLPPIKGEGPVAITPLAPDKPTTPEIVQRPEVSFHGFFVIGSERVAILKRNDRLLLLRAGHALPGSPFVLTRIQPDRVKIVDSENGGREFEVRISDERTRVQMAKVLQRRDPAGTASEDGPLPALEDAWITLPDTQRTLGAYGVYFPPGRSLPKAAK